MQKSLIFKLVDKMASFMLMNSDSNLKIDAIESKNLMLKFLEENGIKEEYLNDHMKMKASQK